MIKNLLNIFLSFVLLGMFSINAFAQEGNLDQLVDDSKNDLLVVVGSGLAGAVLGLSTLSFVEEPKKNTRNILMGASLGVIFGVVFVIYSQANKSSSALTPQVNQDDMTTSYDGSFDTNGRARWHWEMNDSYASPSRGTLNPLSLNYNFSY